MDPEHVGWSDHFLYREKRNLGSPHSNVHFSACLTVGHLSSSSARPIVRISRKSRAVQSSFSSTEGIQRRLARSLHKDDAHKSRNVVTGSKDFLYAPYARMTRIIRVFFVIWRRFAWSPVQGWRVRMGFFSRGNDTTTTCCTQYVSCRRHAQIEMWVSFLSHVCTLTDAH